jgi:predicted nucleic acid-binding protein
VKTSEKLLLDTGILGRLCHPRIEQHRPFTEWLARRLDRGGRAGVILPEIADYELRRKLLHLRLKHPRSRTGLARLDQLVEVLVYLPLSTPVMRRAAELWARARASGLPTAGEAELDGDIILAAQAQMADGTVVTMNPRHLSRFVPVVDWQTIQSEAR